eukprot:CAMPEP_0196728238 /NCGR_PEP_ID=MMETSP1091-20130531/8969_1 /TAXON_ID=302021 /ORGANISM="Rhodomonas sp., Strain CCMP768" /LENGTH=61 /DNA_ID=CAMNT_0042070957 /DNA_START=81 /DNA_END=266 /DNA_ORIENTATION=-
MYELLVAMKGKKAVAHTVPDFQEAVANPDKAMEQVLALKGTHSSSKVRGYDEHSSGKLMPW